MFDRRLMELCPGSRRYIAGNVLFQWLGLLCNAYMIFTAAELLTALYRRDGTVSLGGTALRFAAVLAVRAVTGFLAVRMSFLASRSVKRIIRGRIYDKLLRLGPDYREHTETAALVQETTEGVDQLESYFGQYMPQFFYALLAPLTLFVLFIIAGSLRTALILTVCVPLIPGAIIAVQKIAKKLLSKYWGDYTKLGSSFLENLQGMTTLKIYQADEMKQEQMHAESMHFRDITMKVLTMQLNSVTVMDFFAYGGAALGIAVAAVSFSGGSISLRSCIFMILLSADFFLPMRRLGSYFHVAMNGMAAGDRIFDFLGTREPHRPNGTLSPQGGELRMTNVRFSYDGSREILHSVSLTAKKNRLIAIVGESGSGKSTVAGLLTGRLKPDSGRVTAAGKDLSQIFIKSRMDTITYVGHDSMLFRGTVRENLRPAAPDAPDSRMISVLRSCALWDFFKARRGLDTELTEFGGNLSGGQRQRLALARAVLHDTPIYIFDEATSNIDAESEETVMQQINRLAKQKTVILITHRLANAVNADCIYVMQEGTVAERGTHDRLLSQRGVYRRLWETQQELEHFGEEASETCE